MVGLGIEMAMRYVVNRCVTVALSLKRAVGVEACSN